MSNLFIQFGQPSLGQEEIDAVTEVIKSGWLGFGKKSFEFESKFSEYIGAKYSRSLNSCTSALHVSLRLLNVKKGDEVITTPLTFAATVRAIEMAEAKPVLIDIDPATFNIDPARLESAITKRTKVILPVHFGGMPCDMSSILKIGAERNLQIVEDAAHAVGAEYDGKKIGSSTDSLTCFSFYPNKNITTIEGGMITTANLFYAEQIEILRMGGQSLGAWKRYAQTGQYTIPEVITEGYKYNMTDVNAAVGIAQLAKIETFLLVRERHAKIYDSLLADLSYITLQKRKIENRSVRHGLHLYTLVLNQGAFTCSRQEIINEIRAKGVGVSVHYRPIHEHTYFKNKYNFDATKLPNSTFIANNIISLPLGPAFSDEDIHRAAHIVLEVLTAKLL